ncbi:uncharacterized protein LOC135351160 [Halichondria panicea]|uniref:uncharacterized protein LOC135351160 n=1 Tax=Halichondria panicea TaxID=6063 RepID=UPI00312B9B66
MCPFLHFNNYNIAVAVPKGYDRLGQKKQPFLEIAKDRTGLNEKQIRNWIRRENMKIKHGGIDADESGPSDQYNIPKKSSGPWHQFLKEYGKSEGGKSAIATAGNPGVFNKEASEAYNNLSSDEKQALRERSETNERLSHKGVLKEAEKRFGKIQKLFDELDELGFRGFGFALRMEYTQIVGTSDVLQAFTPEVINWLHAVVTVASPPPFPVGLLSQSKPKRSHPEPLKSSVKPKRSRVMSEISSDSDSDLLSHANHVQSHENIQSIEIDSQPVDKKAKKNKKKPHKSSPSFPS